MHDWTWFILVMLTGGAVLLLLGIVILLSQVVRKLQIVYLLFMAIADAHFEAAPDGGAAWLRRYKQYFG